jgi:hypothetical protein
MGSETPEEVAKQSLNLFEAKTKKYYTIIS